MFLPATTLRAQAPRTLDAAEIELALRKLSVLGSVLYVGAHPDDENTAMLAYLSGERLMRTGYLSLTRGDGGQNLIGTEQGEMLGLVRTEELLAARRIDGAEQFFTRAIDFGFSKTPEETLQVWDREKVLADVVWVIRRFRPDVIITRFPTTGEGGHGHHTASAILAGEAFRAAADPARFPEQLRYVQTWQPKRLFWNSFRPPTEPRKPGAAAPLTVDLGAYNPLLGKSYTEIAALSRSMHKSQGFGSAERRGQAVNTLELIAGDAPDKDMFDGVETSWRRVVGGEAVGQLLSEAARTFNPANPQASLPLLVRAHVALSKLPSDDVWVVAKRRELLEVIRACAGLWMEAIATDYSATPGADIPVNVTLVKRSDFPLRLQSVSMPAAHLTHAVGVELKNNQPSRTELSVHIPADAPLSQPYWLERAPSRGLYTLAAQTLTGQPENAPALSLRVTLSTGDQAAPADSANAPASSSSSATASQTLSTKAATSSSATPDALVFDLPVLFRWTDRVRGEQYRPFQIVPPLSINLEEKTYVFPDRTAKPVHVTVRSNTSANVSGQLRLRVPSGWHATPDSIPVNLKSRNEELTATFNVTPPAPATSGTPASSGASSTTASGTLSAEIESAGALLNRGMLDISYSHLPVQTIFPAAEARLVRLDVQRRGERVGYIMGSGDEIPRALTQLGYHVTLLSDRDLDEANLNTFDAIIAGVRAYNTRPRLRQQARRLLAYVEQGGTYIVQYNVPEDGLGGDFGVYPFKLSRDRVTVEDAPVTLLLPEHPLLNIPNRITAADFDGWVQERGLNFPNEWDERYQTPLASNDPGESAKRGGTLYARYGKGAYIYTSYAWFRQLPAGVPGAYRLFANMIAGGK